MYTIAYTFSLWSLLSILTGADGALENLTLYCMSFVVVLLFKAMFFHGNDQSRAVKKHEDDEHTSD